jgi:hypothetical protein
VGKLIHLIGLILIMAWGLGAFGYNGKSLLFVLLTIAVVTIILKVVQAMVAK